MREGEGASKGVKEKREGEREYSIEHIGPKPQVFVFLF